MNLPAKTPPAYQKLVKDITRLYRNARKALAEFYWFTGKRLVQVEQDGEGRARYGGHLLENLSRDLSQNLGAGFSIPNLRRMRQLYLTNPKRSAPSELDWTQQVELLPIENTKLRSQLEKQAIHEKLTSRELRTLVRRENHLSERNGKPLLPIKGKAGVYRLVTFEGELQWDRGFADYCELQEGESKTFKDGDFVKLTNAGKLEKIQDGKV